MSDDNGQARFERWLGQLDDLDRTTLRQAAKLAQTNEDMRWLLGDVYALAFFTGLRTGTSGLDYISPFDRRYIEWAANCPPK